MATNRTAIDDCPERAVEVVYEKSGAATFDHEVLPRQPEGIRGALVEKLRVTDAAVTARRIRRDPFSISGSRVN